MEEEPLQTHSQTHDLGVASPPRLSRAGDAYRQMYDCELTRLNMWEFLYDDAELR